jgi:hypothetical protein
MSEIRLNVDDRYLQALLGLLKKLDYVEVKKISKSDLTQEEKSTTGDYLSTIPTTDPLHLALKKPIQSVNIEDALINNEYQKTNLAELEKFATELAIPQSADELIAQLSEPRNVDRNWVAGDV